MVLSHRTETCKHRGSIEQLASNLITRVTPSLMARRGPANDTHTPMAALPSPFILKAVPFPPVAGQPFTTLLHPPPHK
ncbi:hypothetical protein E2C01_082824 [Portunus trituberculatus]|uniref:Uncharacterized protein n=1 Tax=Portunus trituberculatus TaxID=210409 RepID=A0A5B7IQX8_PORTR|nr:hypothetical protein [Portunus trituberculatus]